MERVFCVFCNVESVSLLEEMFMKRTLEERWATILESGEDEVVLRWMEKMQEQVQIDRRDREMKLPIRNMEVLETVPPQEGTLCISIFNTDRRANGNGPSLLIDLHCGAWWIGQKKEKYFMESDYYCPLRSPILLKDISSYLCPFIDRSIWKKVFKKLSARHFMMLLQRLGYRLRFYQAPSWCRSVVYWFSV